MTPIQSKRRSGSETLEALTAEVGTQRAQFVLAQVQVEARRLGVSTAGLPYSAYEIPFPLRNSQRTRVISKSRSESSLSSGWNALAMVVRANQAYGELGGHIVCASATLVPFELGFNHFAAATSPVTWCFQPHSAPGVYARKRKVASVKPTSATIDRKCQTVACALSASMVDERILADADWFDGNRADVCYLPGAIHALSAGAWISRDL